MRNKSLERALLFFPIEERIVEFHEDGQRNFGEIFIKKISCNFSIRALARKNSLFDVGASKFLLRREKIISGKVPERV